MSSAPAYLPLFGSDYLADTRHLSTEEHGAYFLLMIAAWRQVDCGLPFDDKKLARIVGLSTRKWGQIRDTILEFWTVENGRIFQPRLLKEWLYVCKKSESNRENSRKRWEKQRTENIEDGSCERISDGNAPQPQPHIEEPNGSSPPVGPPSKNRPAGSVAKRLSEDWSPILTPAAQRTVDGWPPGKFEHELSRFRDHAADKGRTSKDWQAAFRTWITKANEWMNQNGNGPRNRSAPRDTRDGFQRHLDEKLERFAAERASGASGRPDDGAAADLYGLPVPGTAAGTG